MKKIYIILTLFFSFGFAQDLSFEYPKGVYKTFEEFKNKKPSLVVDLNKKITDDSLAFRFNYIEDDKRERKAFAISDGENIYIRVKPMMKQFNRKDKGQLPDGLNRFLRGREIDKYLYFEDYFSSNSAVFLGGVIGASAARRIKGIIYNTETEEFDLFKNKKDFKLFLEENHPDIVEKYESDSKGKEIVEIRKMIDEIAKESKEK